MSFTLKYFYWIKKESLAVTA